MSTSSKSCFLGITWTEETLFEYLLNPKKYIPKTKMNFPGFKSEQDRADCIAYMKKVNFKILRTFNKFELKIFQPKIGLRGINWTIHVIETFNKLNLLILIFLSNIIFFLLNKLQEKRT